jgi:DNA-binding transcriptional ArsR family regulator
VPTSVQTDRLKAVADPLRIRIGLLVLEAPRTVKEMAAALEVPATRLYYHVKILEEHGFIEVVDRRMVSGIEERRYAGIEGAWSLDAEFNAPGPEFIAVLHAALAAVSAEMDVAVHEHEGDELLGTAGAPIQLFTLSDMALTDEDLAELQRRIASIQEDFNAARPDVPAHARRYHWLFAGYVRPGVSGAS